MYSRLIEPPKDKSFFLFGPRGTGKTTWVKAKFTKAIYLEKITPYLKRILFTVESASFEMAI